MFNIFQPITHQELGNQFTSMFGITSVEVMKQHNQGSLYLNLEVASKSNLKMSILKLQLWHVEFKECNLVVHICEFKLK